MYLISAQNMFLSSTQEAMTGTKNGETWKRMVHCIDTYISQMSSGRLAGISVKPLPRQSTTLLLQVQADGQVMELALHDGGSDWEPETMKTSKVGFEK